MVWQGLTDLLRRETLHLFSYVANFCWIGLGIILSAIFLDIEINESRFDFHCGSNGDKELIRGKCYEQYEKQYNKFGIPVYGFVIINFLVTAIVCGIYSKAMKKRVDKLKGRRNGNVTGKWLFKAYCLQLLVRFVLGISFVLLQTKLLYPRSFPSIFNCNLTRDEKFSDITASGSRIETQTQTSYECHNQRATKKTFWADAVIVVTGTFAFLVFIECLYMLLWRVRERSFNAFTEDQNFHKYYLSSNTSNSDSTPSTANELDPLLNDDNYPTYTNPSSTRVQPISTFIENMKERIKRKTERSDDKDPFDPNPGEGSLRDQTLDQIHTNLVIHKGRVNMHHLIAGDRKKRLEEYLTLTKNSRPTQPGDIFDAKKQKILVVGRPGIGKTMFSTKILRNWASDNLFIEVKTSPVDFKVAFLIKLRRFNSARQDETLSLRELLNQSEYSAEKLTEEVWKYILQNPNKVLIIFDGFDEYSGKTKIDNESHPYRDNEQESMPIHFLFKKITSGDILPGATVLTTTRPNAVSCISRLHFDKTVEILGFTTEQVDDYVQKFTNGDDQKANTIKQHINSNRNLLSFCYIPVNCYIICSCLLQLLGHTTGFTSLPTRLTEIYSIAIKMFYFCYDDNQYRHDKAKGQPFILKPFKELSFHVQNVFARLGKIAFDGIRNGKLVFESHEVNNLESNGFFHRLPDTRDRPLAEPKPQYCFLHLTIQEFLAAKYLVDTYSSEDLQKFVSDHIQYGGWRVVMQFVAGLLDENEGQSTDIFSDLLPSKTGKKISEDSEEQSETLTYWPADDEDKSLVVMLFNCMYENKASGRKVQEKLAKIGCNALNFSHCNLSPLDCLALAHAFKSVEGILDFDLSYTNLLSLGCIEIAKLLPGTQHNQGLRKLNNLNLSCNIITVDGTEGIKHLSAALTHTNCKLNSLNLSGNNITAEGVKHLSTALTHTNCKLNSLNLRGNNITDKGVKHISQALTHTNCKLNSLDLTGNNITAKGVKHLSQALTHINCKLLNLSLDEIYLKLEDDFILMNTKCKVSFHYFL